MKKYSPIIRKYLALKVLSSFVAFFLILSLIIFGNQFFLVLKQSLSDGILASELFPLMFLKYIRDLPFIVSFSFSLGIVFSLNRLYKNSELIVLENSGIGDINIFKYLLSLVSIFTVIVFFLSTFVSPLVVNEISLIKESAKSRPDYITFNEGVFQNFNNQNVTFYASDVETNGDNQEMENIFIFFEQESKVISARSGEKKFIKDSGKIFLSLFNGNIYQNIDANFVKNLSISNFRVLDILLFDSSNIKLEGGRALDGMTLSELLNANQLNENVELLYRFSVPISLVIMSLLSIQLSRTTPRKSKNYSLGYGLISYISYYNVIIYMKEAQIKNVNEAVINFLLPHFFVLFFVLVFFYNRSFNFLKK